MKASLSMNKAAERDAPPAWISDKKRREEQWRQGFQRWKEERGLADDVKVFAICPPGGYSDVREALEARGWVENEELESEFYHFKYTIKAKDLKKPPPLDHQQLNHFFNGGALTTKTGLTAHMKGLRWVQDMHQDDIFPRSYNLDKDEDREAWEVDFRWTAAEAILRRVQMDGGLHPAGVTSSEEAAVDAAITVVQTKLAHLRHLVEEEEGAEVAWAPPLPPTMTGNDWEVLLGCSYFDVNVAEAMVTDAGAAAEEADDEDDEDCDGDDPDRELVSDGEQRGGAAADAARAEAAWEASILEGSGELTAEHDEAENGVTRGATESGAACSGATTGETQAAKQARFADVPATQLAPGKAAEIDRLLADMAGRSRQYLTDGCANIWILKPGGKSRGRGIRCVNKLADVHQLLASGRRKKLSRKSNSAWIAMKYVENPLVINRRKFDIRQWVLVTDWNPLTCYFYNENYLRFAAEDYSLEDFHNRFSHLTNNSIAVKSDLFEEGEVGEGNMWHSSEFERWLEEEHGSPGVFVERIQPAMHRCVLSSLAAVQDTVSHRRGTHELFGYDFIIDENLDTWLIEVNCSPTLAHSTPITERLVGSMVEDLMKVVIDLPEARRVARRGEINAAEFDTGLWRCLTSAANSYLPARQPHIMGVPLQLQGHKMKIRRRRNAVQQAAPVEFAVTAGSNTIEASEDEESAGAMNEGAELPLPTQGEPTREGDGFAPLSISENDVDVPRGGRRHTRKQSRRPGVDDSAALHAIMTADSYSTIRRFLKPKLSTRWTDEDRSSAKQEEAAEGARPARRARENAGQRRKLLSDLRAKASSAYGTFAIDQRWTDDTDATCFAGSIIAEEEDDDSWQDDVTPNSPKADVSDCECQGDGELAVGGAAGLGGACVLLGLPQLHRSPVGPMRALPRWDPANSSEHVMRYVGSVTGSDAARTSLPPPRHAAFERTQSTTSLRNRPLSRSDDTAVQSALSRRPLSPHGPANATYQLSFSEYMRLNGREPPEQPAVVRKPVDDNDVDGDGDICSSSVGTASPSAESSPASRRGSDCWIARTRDAPQSSFEVTTENIIDGCEPRRLLKSASSNAFGIDAPRLSDEWTHVSPRALLPALGQHPPSPAQQANGSQHGASAEQPKEVYDPKAYAGGLAMSTLARQTVASMRRLSFVSGGNTGSERTGAGFRPQRALRKPRQLPASGTTSSMPSLAADNGPRQSEVLDTFLKQHSLGAAQVSSSGTQGSIALPAAVTPLNASAQRALTGVEAAATALQQRDGADVPQANHSYRQGFQLAKRSRHSPTPIKQSASREMLAAQRRVLASTRRSSSPLEQSATSLPSRTAQWSFPQPDLSMQQPTEAAAASLTGQPSRLP